MISGPSSFPISDEPIFAGAAAGCRSLRVLRAAAASRRTQGHQDPSAPPPRASDSYDPPVPFWLSGVAIPVRRPPDAKYQGACGTSVNYRGSRLRVPIVGTMASHNRPTAKRRSDDSDSGKRRAPLPRGRELGEAARGMGVQGRRRGGGRQPEPRVRVQPRRAPDDRVRRRGQLPVARGAKGRSRARTGCTSTPTTSSTAPTTAATSSASARPRARCCSRSASRARRRLT